MEESASDSLAVLSSSCGWNFPTVDPKLTGVDRWLPDADELQTSSVDLGLPIGFLTDPRAGLACTKSGILRPVYRLSGPDAPFVWVKFVRCGMEELIAVPDVFPWQLDLLDTSVPRVSSQTELSQQLLSASEVP